MRRFLACLALLAALPLLAANPQQQSQAAQWRDRVLDLSYQVQNHGLELHVLQERLNNQEQIIDTVREDAEKLQALAKDLLKAQSDAVGAKMSEVEGSQARTKQEIGLLQSYASTINEHLAQYHNRLSALEGSVEQQAKSLQALDSAVQSLVEALQPSEKASTGLVHVVVEGDSLGSLAKKYHTTIRKLKESNNLSSDRIIIGQKIKIPATDGS